MVHMAVVIQGVYQNFINVGHHKFPQELSKYIIDKALKDSWAFNGGGYNV